MTGNTSALCVDRFGVKSALNVCGSYTGHVVVAGGRAAACFGAAARQHGDLSAEVVAAADGRVLVLGV